MFSCETLKDCYKHLVPGLFGGKVLFWARVVREDLLKKVDIELER